MGLTDQDLNDFVIFTLKVLFFLTVIRFAIMILGIDIHVPFVDPFLDYIISGIRDILSTFGIRPSIKL